MGRLFSIFESLDRGSGNHDLRESCVPGGRWAYCALNECDVIEREGPLWIGGVDDLDLFSTHDLRKARERVPPEILPFCSSHSPETYVEAEAWLRLDAKRPRTGGQLCLPGQPHDGNAPVPRRGL